ncbi:MAG: hypothetical protein ABL904_24480 [Hyphomicrobiaceae bacterium]
MSYRGRDLDLRTHERMHSMFDQRQADLMAAPTDPVMVDEAVLACCNHGYDLALAHRAREVRVEHLLNAMTRTDAAVSVLTAHGIDVSGLRHDTASLIASDEAIVPGNERVSPRRSQLLADVLHIASDRARMRNSSVTVSDLLRTLFELNSEQSGVVMLKRNAPGWQPRNANEPLRSEPLPPLLGGAYQVDGRYGQQEPPREWVRVAAPQPGYYQAPQPGYYVAEQGGQQPPQSYYSTEPANAATGGTVADVVQNSRLDQLERTIRELSGELLAERKAVSHLIGERKREVPVQVELEPRGDFASAGYANDRLAGIERNVEAKFADLARGWTVLGERLQGLELAVNTSREEAATAPGFEQFNAALATLGERLQGVERQLASRSAAGAAINFEPITERLLAIEQAQTLRPSATAAALAPVIDRLTAIERVQSSRPAALSVDLAPVLDRLQAIETRMAEINRGTSGVVERVGQVERSTNQTGERIRAIEEAMIAQRNQVAQLATNVTADIKALGHSVSTQGANGERIQSLVGERFQSLTSVAEKSRTEASQIIASMGERIGALEKVIQGFGQRTLDLHAAHGADLVELHNALVKLNGNQQTLAASMDQWRLDNGNELSTLLTRLDGVERANAKPLQMLESLQSNVQTLQRSTAKREEQRSRFRQWLMGTDDWYGASWEEPAGKGQPRNGNAAISQPRPASAPGDTRRS